MMAFTGEKKAQWQREHLKEYAQEHPDRIKKYHRTAALERARKQGYLPAKRTIVKYEITSAELERLASCLVQNARANEEYAGRTATLIA